jgi:hypothetical protein
MQRATLKEYGGADPGAVVKGVTLDIENAGG